MYFVTNQENKTWRGLEWGENVTHSEENTNYQFWVYESPLVAAFMSPMYDGITNPKIYTCVGDTSTAKDHLRHRFKTLTSLKIHPNIVPTKSQSIIFGILAAINTVQTSLFSDWAKKYLQDGIVNEEEISKLEKQIIQLAYDENDELNMPAPYTSPCMAVFESVKSEFPEKFAANAAHRAFVDYHDDIISSPINLHQLATIALSVPQLEIIKILNG
jgi:hypothetical protein